MTYTLRIIRNIPTPYKAHDCAANASTKAASKSPILVYSLQPEAVVDDLQKQIAVGSGI